MFVSPNRTDDDASFGQVDQEAFLIGKKLGLPPNWLNGDCHGFAHMLPSDWKSRRHLFGRFGLLWVFYVDRLDLIVLKALSGRDVDILDLQRIRVTKNESAFVRTHLNKLLETGQFSMTKVKEIEIVLTAVETRP